jgi:hypothetical protein
MPLMPTSSAHHHDILDIDVVPAVVVAVPWRMRMMPWRRSLADVWHCSCHLLLLLPLDEWVRRFLQIDAWRRYSGSGVRLLAQRGNTSTKLCDEYGELDHRLATPSIVLMKKKTPI